MKLKGLEANTDWIRIVKILAGVVVSAFVGLKFQPLLENNANAVNTIVTIFSILAGFLIAVITFIAEPVLKQAKDWHELQLMKKTIQRQLFRQKLLFFLYLLTLGLALAMFLVPPEKPVDPHATPPQATATVSAPQGANISATPVSKAQPAGKVVPATAAVVPAKAIPPQDTGVILHWLQGIFLGLATFVFLASFSLPGSLMKIQMERYEAALDETKPKVLKETPKVD